MRRVLSSSSNIALADIARRFSKHTFFSDKLYVIGLTTYTVFSNEDRFLLHLTSFHTFQVLSPQSPFAASGAAGVRFLINLGAPPTPDQYLSRILRMPHTGLVPSHVITLPSARHPDMKAIEERFALRATMIFPSGQGEECPKGSGSDLPARSPGGRECIRHDKFPDLLKKWENVSASVRWTSK